ncbi:MAG: nucleotidyl transferase AbiEii/AbiGii toxin family protein [Nanoarchaeota archaeon]|nr:nucleotidyl transferase AbiEii/AbiGii toxin family protein [Nanoarchaeota archaeon]MBU1269685.1 nucleotidyl transferase AbiEii/AbiGii toxin family protein [Nanoarchaeota archaeon]MBU1605133.1 nucleotidyl transferase AbiEii/AbiGii toxin family protein [Nanoarchaeota archaeon]MBU2442914.1 nucleotidyl transferase AbiEii/AbiGii toxin family protein [Nanoarchaeota archaeon]
MNLRELRQLAAKNELSLNFIAKDLIISKTLVLLQEVQGIVLKGGTAINRIYLKQQMRFSEDIDLDLNFDGTPKEALKKTEGIVKKLDIFDKIDKPRIMNSTIRYDLYFTNPLGQKDKIRLEFKVKKITEKYSKEIVNFGFTPTESALLNVYDKKVLIKHKIDCLLSRKEGKDIYDLYYLLGEDTKNLKVNLDMEKNEIKKIANSTNHYIPRKLRPNWPIIIEKLKEKFSKIN